MHGKKVYLFIFSTILFLCILSIKRVLGFLYVRNVDQQDKQRMRDLYAEVEPLQRQREALIAERDRLETEYTLQMRDVGTVELLFRQLNVSIFTDVYPKMRDLGVIGVLGVNNHEYPGYGYRMSLEQFSRLVKDGWGCCFIYESTSDFDSWYEGMAQKLENDGLPVPRAIYFPDNTYSNAINASLIRCGIDTVIRGASDGHSATVTAQNGKLWYTGAMPWNYTGVTSDTELLGMKHREDEKRTGTYVTISAFQQGIGTGICGPQTKDEFKYTVKDDYELRFIISCNGKNS